MTAKVEGKSMTKTVEVARTYVPFFYEWEETMDLFDFEENGRLFVAMIKYGAHGDVPDFGDNRALKVFWLQVRKQFDRSNKNYDNKVAASNEGDKTPSDSNKSADKAKPAVTVALKPTTPSQPTVESTSAFNTDFVANVLAYREKHSIRDVAEHLNVPISRVQRVIKEFGDSRVGVAPAHSTQDTSPKKVAPAKEVVVSQKETVTPVQEKPVQEKAECIPDQEEDVLMEQENIDPYDCPTPPEADIAEAEMDSMPLAEDGDVATAEDNGEKGGETVLPPAPNGEHWAVYNGVQYNRDGTVKKPAPQDDYKLALAEQERIAKEKAHPTWNGVGMKPAPAGEHWAVYDGVQYNRDGTVKKPVAKDEYKTALAEQERLAKNKTQSTWDGVGMKPPPAGEHWAVYDGVQYNRDGTVKKPAPKKDDAFATKDNSGEKGGESVVETSASASVQTTAPTQVDVIPDERDEILIEAERVARRDASNCARSEEDEREDILTPDDYEAMAKDPAYREPGFEYDFIDKDEAVGGVCSAAELANSIAKTFGIPAPSAEDAAILEKTKVVQPYVAPHKDRWWHEDAPVDVVKEEDGIKYLVPGEGRYERIEAFWRHADIFTPLIGEIKELRVYYKLIVDTKLPVAWKSFKEFVANFDRNDFRLLGRTPYHRYMRVPYVILEWNQYIQEEPPADRWTFNTFCDHVKRSLAAMVDYKNAFSFDDIAEKRYVEMPKEWDWLRALFLTTFDSRFVLDVAAPLWDYCVPDYDLDDIKAKVEAYAIKKGYKSASIDESEANDDDTPMPTFDEPIELGKRPVNLDNVMQQSVLYDGEDNVASPQPNNKPSASQNGGAKPKSALATVRENRAKVNATA